MRDTVVAAKIRSLLGIPHFLYTQRAGANAPVCSISQIYKKKNEGPSGVGRVFLAPLVSLILYSAFLLKAKKYLIIKG